MKVSPTSQPKETRRDWKNQSKCQTKKILSMKKTITSIFFNTKGEIKTLLISEKLGCLLITYLPKLFEILRVFLADERWYQRDLKVSEGIQSLRRSIQVHRWTYMCYFLSLKIHEKLRTKEWHCLVNFYCTSV